MIDPIIAGLIGTLITAIASISVAIIQARISKSQSSDKPNGLLIPEGVKLIPVNRSRKTILWIVAFTLVGGFAGYFIGGGAQSFLSLISVGIQPTEISSPSPSLTSKSILPTETVASLLSDTPISNPAVLQPNALLFIITSQTIGEVEVQLTTLRIALGSMGGSSGSGNLFQDYTGVPLENGLVVSFDYISRVEFENDENNIIRAKIILIDNSMIENGLNPAYISGVVQGEGALGDYKRQLSEIKTIVITREATSSTLPYALPDSLKATVYYEGGGGEVQISDPQLVFLNRGERGFGVYWCNNFSYDYFPTQEGLQLQFSQIRDIEFEHEDGVIVRVLASITTSEGQTAKFHLDSIEQALPCFDTNGWWLKGKVAIGDFAIPLLLVSKIHFD